MGLTTALRIAHQQLLENSDRDVFLSRSGEVVQLQRNHTRALAPDVARLEVK
jgi:hypothetical protein